MRVDTSRSGCYSRYIMVDAVTLLRENHAKLTQRAAKLRSQLETTERELRDVDTAVRVMARLGLAPEVVADDKEASGSTADLVITALQIDGEGHAPKDVYAKLVDHGVTHIQSDNVRTALWRLARDNRIRVKEGRYWRLPSSAPHAEGGPETNPEPPIAFSREEPSTTSDIPMFATAGPGPGR